MEEQTILYSARRSFNRLGFGLFTMAAVSFLAQLLLGVILVLCGQSDALTGSGTLTALLGFLPLYGIALPIGWLVLRKAPAAPYTPLKLRSKDYWTLFLMCFPLLYGGSILGSTLSEALSGGESVNPVDSLVSDPNWLQILITVAIAPMLEEFFFRRQLIDRSACYGEKTAILFSALMFGLFHMNLYQFFYAFALGLVFGYVYLRTRRLRYTIFMHMSINFLGGIVPTLLMRLIDDDTLALLESESLTTEAIQANLPQYPILNAYSLSVMGLCIAGIAFFVLKRKHFIFFEAPQELPQGTRLRSIYCRPGVILFIIVCIAVSVLYLTQY